MNTKYFSILFFLLPYFISAQQVTRTNVPDWISRVPVELESKIKSNQVSEGYYYSISDKQVNISENTIFSHYSRKIFNNAGVQNGSEIQVTYDPSYQKLAFHYVTIWRNGKAIDKLNVRKFKILQKEEDQERFLYDGRLTALMVLEDVREGDIIEYAFSLTGFNPIYKGKYFGSFDLQFQDPTDHLFLKVISPNDQLHYKLFNAAPEPTIIKKGAQTEYIIDLRNVKPYKSEDYLPSWIDVYPYISFTEFTSWDEFGNWVEQIFLEEKVDKEITAVALELTKGTSSLEEKALRLVRFVQDEIRYTGYEGGISGYKPHNPSKVLKQRFGDCKDKSWLLVNLLQSIGIDADPALVNTYYKHTVKSWLPTAYAFNHCVVQAEINDKTIWIDATSSQQGGGIFTTCFPDYKLAFVIEKGKSAFRSINNYNLSKTEVKEIVKMDHVNGGCSYSIETTHYGTEADYQRSYFFNNSIQSIQEGYLNFYAEDFIGIDTTTILSYVDDTLNNTFKINEKYQITELWEKNQEDSSQITASFFPRSLYDKFRIPSSKNRKLPMALSYPSEYSQVTEIHLPEPWQIKKVKRTIDHSSFSYSDVHNYANQTCYLIYNYKTLKDLVDVEEFKSYFKQIGEIEKQLTFQFTYTLPKTTSPTSAGVWGMWIFYLFISAISILLCYKLYYYNPDHRMSEQSFEYSEIGGWLILVALALISAPLRILFEMGKESYFDSTIWQALSYSSLIGILFVLEATVNVVSFFMFTLLAYLFFTRRTSFPIIFIIVLISRLAFFLLDNLILYFFNGSNMPESEIMKSLAQMLIFTAIWIPYIWYSERAKGTFIMSIE